MYNNTTYLINVTIFTDGANADNFYNTLASVGAVFVITMCTFFIYMMSKLNENIHKKDDEIKKYDLEVYEYYRENERICKDIDELTHPDGTFKDEEEYRRCSESIVNNNLYKEHTEDKIRENKSLIKHNEKIKEDVIKSIRYIYPFSFMFVILPLFFLSFPNSEKIALISDVLKIPILGIFCWFIMNIIKICVKILKYDTYS